MKVYNITKDSAIAEVCEPSYNNAQRARRHFLLVNLFGKSFIDNCIESLEAWLDNNDDSNPYYVDMTTRIEAFKLHKETFA
jgi:hypothetical protein